MHEGCVGIKI